MRGVTESRSGRERYGLHLILGEVNEISIVLDSLGYASARVSYHSRSDVQKKASLSTDALCGV